MVMKVLSSSTYDRLNLKISCCLILRFWGRTLDFFSTPQSKLPKGWCIPEKHDDGVIWQSYYEYKKLLILLSL